MRDNPRLRREELLERLATHCRGLVYPRWTMALVVFLSGLSGFLSSVFLHKIGLHSMGVRYLIAPLVAYAVFLLLLGMWLSRTRKYASEIPISEEEALHAASNSPQAKGRFDPFLTPFDFPLELFGEGCMSIALVIFAVGSAVGVSFYLIWVAPVFLSELALDGVVCYGVYYRMRNRAPQHWISGVARRTFSSFLGLLFFFAFTGLMLDLLAPHADSMGKAIAEILQS